MHVVALQHLLDFDEDLNRCVFWVNPHLQHDWLAGDVVELAILWGGDEIRTSLILPDVARCRMCRGVLNAELWVYSDGGWARSLRALDA